MTKTKKNLFGLSKDQLKLVTGGTGVVVNGTGGGATTNTGVVVNKP